MTNVLLLEPYYTGSHREWADGYRVSSDLSVQLLTMPGRFWKWRMHGAAITMARRVRLLDSVPDVIVASDMLDLAAFLGLTRDYLCGVPTALYMHENQLAYPAPPPSGEWSESRRRRAERHDAHYPFTNLTSAVAADTVLWNSDHNMSSFLGRLPEFLGSFPDSRETDLADVVRHKSHVLPLGMDLSALDDARPQRRAPGPPRVLWNHRWEHDKDPERFFGALYELADAGLAFEVIVVGESFVRTPPAFENARERLGERIIHFGHVPDREAYARILWQADVVVSTARHEFFGASVCEAVYCGCAAVLPAALSYPDLVPRQHHDAVLYTSSAGLLDRLAAAITVPDDERQTSMRAAVSEYDWGTMAPEYDRRLSALAARGPRRPGAHTMPLLPRESA